MWAVEIGGHEFDDLNLSFSMAMQRVGVNLQRPFSPSGPSIMRGLVPEHLRLKP